MKHYEKPTAARLALTSDVILTSAPKLQNGDSTSLVALQAFSWND